MKPGFYMHEDAMDCFIEILLSKPKIESYVVRWWNLGFTGNPWLLPRGIEIIRIETPDLIKWKQINPLTHRKLK